MCIGAVVGVCAAVAFAVKSAADELRVVDANILTVFAQMT